MEIIPPASISFIQSVSAFLMKSMRRHLLPRGARILPPSAEQTGEQRHQRHADERHAAARHELFHSLAFCAGVVIAVTFQKIDRTPDAEASAEGDDQRLEHLDSRIEKLHSKTRGRTAHKAQTAGPAPASFQYVIESSRFPLGFVRSRPRIS